MSCYFLSKSFYDKLRFAALISCVSFSLQAYAESPHSFHVLKSSTAPVTKLAVEADASFENHPLSDKVDLSPVEMRSPEPNLLGEDDNPNDREEVLQRKKLFQKTPITPAGTSRPSFTDAVTTVPQGSLQFENGATFINNRGGTYSWTTPETLMRLGVLQNTELRFTVPNYIYAGNKQPGHLANNFGDISAGFSQHVLLPGKVDFAVIPLLNIPTGANLVSSQSLDPQLRLVVGRNATKKLYLSSMLDTRWYTGKAAAAHVVINPTLIGYYSLSKKLTGFLEYAAFLPSEGKSSHYAQTGALYLISPRNQVDVRIAAGLNSASPNFLVGFGYSFRVDGLFGASRAFSSFKRGEN